MTKIDKARLELLRAATNYGGLISDGHRQGFREVMDAADALEVAARHFAKQCDREMREYRAIAKAIKP